MIQKVLTLLVSMKFMAMVAATWLFAVGTLSENGWVMIILTVVGMKEAGKMASAYRDIKTAHLAKVKK